MFSPGILRWCLPVAFLAGSMVLSPAPGEAQGFGGFRHGGPHMRGHGPAFGPGPVRYGPARWGRPGFVGRPGYPGRPYYGGRFGPRGYPGAFYPGPFHPGPVVGPGWRPYHGGYRPAYWRGPYYRPHYWGGPYWRGGYDYGPWDYGVPVAAGLAIGAAVAAAPWYDTGPDCYRASKPVLNRYGRWVKRVVTVCHDP